MRCHVYALLLVLQLGLTSWTAEGVPSKQTTTNQSSIENAGNAAYYIARDPVNAAALADDIPAKQPSFGYDNNPTDAVNSDRDGESSKKIIGSSVVTSVSVILNGDEPQYTDAVGHKVPKPPPSLQVASPINLLNPDRYEFYTFDDNGDLVKRLMTMQEIQSIVANGDGEGPTIIHTAPIEDRDPEKNVQDIVYSVQNVLNKQVENKSQTTTGDLLPVLDTPDVYSSWSMILPAIFGNTGGDIYPQQKPQQIVMTPDSELVDLSTKEESAATTTKKPKPTKRKPGQKRKPSTTTTTAMTPQVVQEELEPHESVYTGVQQYQDMATNVQDFEAFSNIHLQPIYHKLPTNTTRHVFVNNQEKIQTTTAIQNEQSTSNKLQPNENSTKKPSNAQQQKHTTPHRKNATKRPRPTASYTKGQKKPATSQTSHTPGQIKQKPTKAVKPIATKTASTTSTTETPSTAATITTTTTTSTVATTPEATTTPEVETSTATTVTTPKKKKKKPTRPTTDSVTHTRPHQTTQKRKHITTQKPTHSVDTEHIKQKPATEAVANDAETHEIVHKTHNRKRPKPNKNSSTTTTMSTTTSMATASVPTASTEGTLISENFEGISESQTKTTASRISATTIPAIKTHMPLTTQRPTLVSFGYPVPTYGAEQPIEAVDQITINQLKHQTVPSLSLIQQHYQQQLNESPDSATEEDLRLSFGQIAQSLKQDNKAGVQVGTDDTVRPIGYDSAENIEKLEEMANKRRKPYPMINGRPTTQEIFTAQSTVDTLTLENLSKPTTGVSTTERPIKVEQYAAIEASDAKTTTDIFTETTVAPIHSIEIPDEFTGANAVRFEPLLADVAEPTLKDLPTTTAVPLELNVAQEDINLETSTKQNLLTTFEGEEFVLTTTDIPMQNEENNDSMLLTVPQQIEMYLANSKEESTSMQPASIADLNTHFRLESMMPIKPIGMSNFQTHAATVASNLIDGAYSVPVTTITSQFNETNNEIELLMSDVIQQINEQNANITHNSLTNLSNFNTAIPSESTSDVSSAEQDITQMLTSIANEQTLDSDMTLTTTEAVDQTSTILPIDEDNLSMQKYDFPTDAKHEISIEDSTTSIIITDAETTTIYPVLSTEAENKLSNNNDSNHILYANNAGNSVEHQFEQNIPAADATNIDSIMHKSENSPAKLNKSEQNTAVISSGVQDLKEYKASDEELVPAYTTSKYNNNVENNEDIDEDFLENITTENINIVVKDSSGVSEIKVNDAAEQQLLVTTNIEDNVAGAAQLEPQYELVTETSIEHEKQSTNKLDIPNPINSASQSTENVQILSAINNNLQETMSLNESSTEISLGIATVDNINESQQEVATETVVDAETEVTEEEQEQEDSTAQSTDTFESTTLAFNEVSAENADTSTEQQNYVTMETSTDKSENEDPYVKLGETTVIPPVIFENLANISKNVVDNITDVETATLTTNVDIDSTEKPTISEQNTTFSEMYANLDTKPLASVSNDELIKDIQTTTTTTSSTTTPVSKTTLDSTTTASTPAQINTTKRMNTLKPVSYYKQPSLVAYNQPEYPKPITYVSQQQRPMQRPAALSNLMAGSTQATRPPVRLEPSPNQSKGLEASTLSLDPDVLAFSRLCNELAFSYWKSITSEKISSARSLVISPFALTSMLSMVFLGARGSTSGEMNEVLKLDDMVTFNPHLIFKNITDSVERATDSDIATAAFVREIFSDRANGRILQFFKEKTQQFYAGHVEEVNFHVVNDVIRRRTNLLVKRHTMGKVQEYLRTNSVWVNGPLATISANLFQTDCARGSTSDRDGELFFQVHPTVRQRRLVPVPAVLYKTGFTAGYDAKLDATVVAFGRIQDTVSTIYVMPGHQNTNSPSDNLDRLEKHLSETAFSENAWSNILTTLMDRPGLEVQLPRFSHRSFVNASLGLQKMGLKGLFQSDFADLRGLTGSSNRDVFLSDMIQINTFSTCGEERIADQHHVEMYPAPPLRKRNKDMETNDEDMLDSSEAIIDFGSLVQESALARSFYDDLLDPKYLELPLPLRPRQARVPDAPPRLRFDKPFLYFVRHNPTGIILFMGRFNPRLLP